jgi:hypothetical protein
MMHRPVTDDNYTAGILCLKSGANHVQAWMAHTAMPFFLLPLNETWSLLLIEDDKLEQPETMEMLIECSKFVSLLYFFHDEDWGWGYRIYVNGFEVACFYDDYHFDHTMALRLAQERYPEHEDILSFLYFDQEGRQLLDTLVEEVNGNPDYLAWEFKDRNVEFFKVFHLDLERIEQLKHLVSVEGLRDRRLHWRQVQQFKDLVGIAELDHLNFKRQAEGSAGREPPVLP